MKKILASTLLTIALSSFSLKTADPDAYECYTAKGKEIDFEDALKQLEDADVILWGELHDNPMCHWLQLRTAKHMHEKFGKKLILGAEMFETDNQVLMDEYTSGRIPTRNFEDELKKWTNYKTDYKPLVEFAREKQLRMVCSNVPRRYANLVYRKGLAALDSLTEEAKTLLPPLPIAYDSSLACYSNMLKMMPGGHGGQTLPMAQALKDATMAWNIQKAWEKGHQLIHFNGAYHSDDFESIVWYLKQYDPKLKVMTISTVMQADTEPLDKESHGKADFILVVPEDMTRTH